ncbi:tRNA-splicing endonuclease subunit Sen15 [Astrocystis sublimbata]|nr:tRNA-splicing endonuclease subunit Sen15 [Astrocystis sublimbata]
MAERGYGPQLADTVLDNLKYQHDWTELQVRTHSSTSSESLMRPMISGLPPQRLYVHPDDQIAMVRASTVPTGALLNTPETEWVLPTHISEKWSLEAFSTVFDSLPAQPSTQPGRAKRIVLAVLHPDSTVVYYHLHDGIVKPRQN